MAVELSESPRVKKKGRHRR